MAEAFDGDGHIQPHLHSQAQPERPMAAGTLSRFGWRRSHQSIPPHGSVGPVIATPKPGSRRAVVKAGVIQASPSASLGVKTGRHLAYLAREGSGVDGSKAEVFTRDGTLVDAKAFQQAADKDPHQYHVVLSLADGNRMNMERFTRDFMETVEKDLHRRLDYVFSVHSNTGIRHAHIDIRGRDQRGQVLTIHSRYLRQGMRYRAQQLATDYLGKVPERDLAREASRTTTLESYIGRHSFHARRVIETDAADTSQTRTPPQTVTPLEQTPRVTPQEKLEVIAGLSPQAQAFLRSAVPHLFREGKTPAPEKSIREQVTDLQQKLHSRAAVTRPSAEYGGGLGR